MTKSHFLNKLIQSRAFKNSYWSLFEVAIVPLFTIALAPFFIENLGDEQYGIWVLANSIGANLGVLNLGLSAATIKFISEYRQSNCNGKIRIVIQSSFNITLLTCSLIALLGFVLSFFIESGYFFSVSSVNKNVFFYSIQLGVLLFALKLFEQFLLSIFQGYERYDLSSKTFLISRILIITSTYVSIYYKYSLVLLFSINIILFIFILFIEIFFVKKFVQGISFFSKPNTNYLKKVFSYGKWTWVYTLFGTIGGHLDKFVIGSLAGVKYLGYYSIGVMIAEQIQRVLVASVRWIFPYISRISTDKRRVRKVFLKIHFLFSMLSILFITLLYLFGDPLFSFWLGSEIFQKSIEVIHVFLYYSMFLAIGTLSYFFLNALNYVRENALIMVFSSFMVVIVMLASYNVFGLKGIYWGKLMLPVSLSTISIFLLSKKIAPRSSHILVWTSVLPIFILIIFLLHN